MEQQSRKFVVFDKKTGTSKTITGRHLLAKELNTAMRQIPNVHMLKVTFGDKVVMEVKQPEEAKE